MNKPIFALSLLLVCICNLVTATSSQAQLKVTIHQATNFDSQGLAIIEKSRLILEQVLNSEEFKQKVLSFQYLGQNQFVQNNGLNNSQILEKIMGAAEIYPNVSSPDNEIDLSVQLYTSSWSGRNVIGYTTPTTDTVFMNTYFFYYATPSEIAGNLAHEWQHKISFDHDYKATARRPYSVPYGIGYIVKELAKKYE